VNVSARAREGYMLKSSEKKAVSRARMAAVKRPYASPKLVEYGSVAKLTATNGTILPQDDSTQMMMGQGPG